MITHSVGTGIAPSWRGSSLADPVLVSHLPKMGYGNLPYRCPHRYEGTSPQRRMTLNTQQRFAWNLTSWQMRF